MSAAGTAGSGPEPPTHTPRRLNLGFWAMIAARVKILQNSPTDA